MLARSLSKLFPAIAVSVLLCLAAAAPSRQAGPAPPTQLQKPCDDFASAVAGDSTASLTGPGGFEQALPAGMSVAACSLRTSVRSPWSGANMELREWDPTTLAPDPDAIALRRFFFDPSRIIWNGNKLPRATFVPPVVVGSVSGVAEPPKPHVAMQLRGAGSTFQPFTVFFNPDGPAELPAAVRLGAGDSRGVLPGPHPVLAHAVCAGDTDLAALRVVQGVSRTDVKPFPAPKEFLQRFRVPQEVELRWIELGLAEVFNPYFAQAGDEPSLWFGAALPVLAVIDGDDMPAPEPDVPSPLIEARLLPFADKAWISHQDLDHTVTLEPDHDYWIWVRDAAQTTFFNRRVHGDEPPAFVSGVGPYFARHDTAGPWNQAADQVLAFRIVGRPIAPPAPPPGRAAAAFALSTTPNPAPGSVRVSWSGAVGPVRFEVMDARGRRVSEGSGGAAGSWTWPGTDRDGRAVASGIYFVRARDSAGQYSNQRVMVVR